MKFILQILLILLVASTIAICTTKPDMHKNIIVYDSAYTLVPEKQAEIEKEVIPIMEKQAEPVQTKIEVPKQTVVPVKQTQVKSTKTTEIKTPKAQTVKQVQKTQTAVPAKTTHLQKTITAPKVNTTVKPETRIVEKPVIKTEPKPIVVHPQQKVETVTKSEPPKVLTEQEETIAWNSWRSNVQNKIMQDTKLPILPNGTVFKFSFTVDKYGKISNVQTWSETPSYTPYAIQYIAPVIRSYQGRSILNFPTGTARTVTEVRGGWRISANEKYSKPSDYNDVEKVLR